MSIDKERAAVAAAHENLLLTRARYHEQAQALEVSIKRHRAVCVIGAGLGAGLIVGRLPIARFLRSAASLFSLGTSILRTPLGAMALRVFAAREQPKAGDPGSG